MQPQVNRRIKKMLWTDEERRYLLKSAGVLPVHVIAKNLGRTVQAIKKQANKSGINLKVVKDATAK